jgi:hypothetical protein
VTVQDGYIQYLLQIIVCVISDVGMGPVRFNEVITFLPNPDGMGFDPRQLLEFSD